MHGEAQRLGEIEKRLKRVEKITAEGGFNFLSFQKSSPVASLEHGMRFCFKVASDASLKLSFNVKSTSGMSFVALITVNGAAAYTGRHEGGDCVIECVLPFLKGDNEIYLSLQGGVPFAVERCVMQTFGCVCYPEYDCCLNVINYEDKSFILFVSEGRAIIYSYDGQTVKELRSYEGIKSGALAKHGQNLLVALCDEVGVARVYFYTEASVALGEVMLSEDVISVCALSGEPCTLFAVKGNTVYRYTVSSSLNLTEERTRLRAKSVRSNPDVSGYIITVDYDGNGKLVSV